MASLPQTVVYATRLLLTRGICMFITPKALYWVSRSALVTSRRRLHSLRARSARYEIDSRVIGAFPETSANYSRAPDSRPFGAARDGDAAPNAAAPCGVSCFGGNRHTPRAPSGYTLHAQPRDAWQRIPSSLTHTMRSGGASPQSPRHLDEAPVITLTRKRVAGGIVRAHVQNTSSLQMYYHYNTSINYFTGPSPHID